MDATVKIWISRMVGQMVVVSKIQERSLRTCFDPVKFQSCKLLIWKSLSGSQKPENTTAPKALVVLLVVPVHLLHCFRRLWCFGLEFGGDEIVPEIVVKVRVKADDLRSNQNLQIRDNTIHPSSKQNV
jgi:hypothetical protein